MQTISPLHYYAAAREWGWSPYDEDSATEFCQSEGLTAGEIFAADSEFWRAEFESLKN